MKKYYIFTNRNEVEYIGQFESFYEAWDFVDIEQQLNFLWLIEENDLMRVAENIYYKLGLKK